MEYGAEGRAKFDTALFGLAATDEDKAKSWGADEADQARAAAFLSAVPEG